MKKMAMLMVLVMAVAFAAAPLMAAEKATKVQSVSGEIVKIDAAKGTLVVKIKDKNQSLKAEPQMLEGISVGQKVTIQKSGAIVKSIQPA